MQSMIAISIFSIIHALSPAIWLMPLKKVRDACLLKISRLSQFPISLNLLWGINHYIVPLCLTSFHRTPLIQTSFWLLLHHFLNQSLLSELSFLTNPPPQSPPLLTTFMLTESALHPQTWPPDLPIPLVSQSPLLLDCFLLSPAQTWAFPIWFCPLPTSFILIKLFPGTPSFPEILHSTPV